MAVSRLSNTDKFAVSMDILGSLVNIFHGRIPNEKTKAKGRWNCFFYEEMSSVAENADELGLLSSATSSSDELFSTFTVQRHIDRDGQTAPYFNQHLSRT